MKTYKQVKASANLKFLKGKSNEEAMEAAVEALNSKVTKGFYQDTVDELSALTKKYDCSLESLLIAARNSFILEPDYERALTLYERIMSIRAYAAKEGKNK